MTVLDIARDALATGPLCNACLGRLVADRSFGLGNADRGRALRTTVALEDDEPYEEPEDCWVCEGECDRIDIWADRAVQAVAEYDFDTYQVGSRVPPMLEENDVLLREDVGLEEDAGELLKSELNREVGKRFGRETGTEVDFERPDIQLLLDLGTDEVELQVNSAFVYGRYKKLERDIPQTKWPCNECGGSGLKRGAECPGCDGRGFRYPESVEQLTAPPVVDAYAGESATFHGAGREDVDALMLGTGRPFVIEVDDPHTRAVDPEALEREINAFADGKVEVTDVSIPTYEMVERVKEHDASKTYRMAVEFDDSISEDALQDALDELRGATITQRTPQRVDHRRADIDRTREVYDVEGELEDDTHATIELHGEGGLYVKELVSGDEGRTEPSLAGLLDIGAVVTALDVLAVEGEDEPFATEDFLADQE